MPKYLALDLDGTLFYPKCINRCIPKKNVRFLREWIDNGNKVILVTSRSYEFVSKKLFKEIKRPVDLICSTSAQIVINGEKIRDENMNNEHIGKIIAEIEEKYQPLAMLMFSDDHSCLIKNVRTNWFFAIIYKLYWWFQFAYREDYLIDNQKFDEELKKGKIKKIMTFFGLRKKNGEIAKEINRELRNDYPEIESSWTVIVNELSPKDCNKGEGLKRYCKYLNIDPNDVYVVGDSGNDIAMFTEYHEHSYCMAHSYSSVKKYAKHVITSVHKLKSVLKGE